MTDLSHTADPEAADPFEAEHSPGWPIGRIIWIGFTLCLLLIPAVLAFPLVLEARARSVIFAAGGMVEVTDEIPVWLEWVEDVDQIQLLLPVALVNLDDCRVDERTWQAVLQVAGPKLNTVWLDRTGTTDGQLSQLTRHAPGLTWLTVLGSRLTDDGLTALSGCSRLNHLAVDSPKFTSAALEHLPPLPALVNLQLSGIELNRQTLEGVGRCPRLESLTLTGTIFPDESAIGDLPTQSYPLTELHISESTMTAAGLRTISSLQNVHTLNFTSVAFSTEGCDVLSDLPHLDHVTLYGCQVSDECVSQLAECPTLTSITLWNSKISGTCLEALSRLPEVTYLDLDGTAITEENVRFLAEFPKLWSLDLSNTKIGDGAVPHLVQCSRVERLSIEGTRITPQGIEQLKQALPRCEVSSEESFPVQQQSGP